MCPSPDISHIYTTRGDDGAAHLGDMTEQNNLPRAQWLLYLFIF